MNLFKFLKRKSEPTKLTDEELAIRIYEKTRNVEMTGIKSSFNPTGDHEVRCNLREYSPDTIPNSDKVLYDLFGRDSVMFKKESNR